MGKVLTRSPAGFLTQKAWPQRPKIITVELTPEALKPYRDGWRRRRAARDATVAARRERAWQVARQADRLLREAYGARGCGSSAPWPGAASTRRRISTWPLPVSPRPYISGPSASFRPSTRTPPSTWFGPLIGRIWPEFQEVSRAAERAAELSHKALQTGDDGYGDGAALNLHSFYTGLERLFEAIAREVDGRLPRGPDWYRDLLGQMSAEVPGIRPPVLSRETRACLNEYRGFGTLCAAFTRLTLTRSGFEPLPRG